MPILLTALLCTLFLGVGIVYFASRISGYSHRRHTISELGEIGTPHSRLVGLGLFLPVGLCCLALARQFIDTVAPGNLSRGASTLAISLAVGYLVAAFFPCDPGSPLQGSWRQGVHNLGGGAEYVGGATGLWLIGGALRAGTSELVIGMTFIVGAGVVGTSVLVLSSSALFRWRGVVQRIAEVVLFAALVVVAYFLDGRTSAA
jgi:hypothetical membrane protein